MPGGGRGTLTEIAISLNHEKHTEIAEAIKMAIEIVLPSGDDGYQIDTSPRDIGTAFQNCNNTDSLRDVYCHALEHKKVVLEY